MHHFWPCHARLCARAVFSDPLPVSEIFCASYVACPCPEMQQHYSTSSFKTIDLARHFIPTQQASTAQEVPLADLLPPHIYSHRKFPELAYVHKLNKFTSLLPVTHIVSAQKGTSISQKCYYCALRTGTISKAPHILTPLKTTSLDVFFFFS